jgi:hypothetical protein
LSVTLTLGDGDAIAHLAAHEPKVEALEVLERAKGIEPSTLSLGKSGPAFSGIRSNTLIPSES